MKNLSFVIALLLLISNTLFAQVSINNDNSQPDPSSMLDVKSATKGLLLPRITRVQRDAISNPANGLMVFCTNCGTDGSLSFYSNGAWKTFSPCTIAPPVAGTHLMSQGQIIWNWNAVVGATGYKWSATTNYETAINMGASLSKTETGLSCNVTYTRYIWAYSGCSESGMTTLTTTVPAMAPVTPTAGIHLSTPTSIVWNWNTVTDAAGYKWNTTNDYGTAIDMGTATTKNETGITCGTAYTRYVWAYNGCGYSTPLTLTQSTLTCWICGIPFTINHVTTGGVAPIDKTVTYGTATNIPGETSKCWITSNLGADHQATTVSDATEASAGWYWQFNRKQGYKHDGTTRTPSTDWITFINENLDWQAARDPCTLELASGWRLPTYTEWLNVDASGNWTNWNGPWNSDLKLHAAGYLNTGDGSLSSRGSYGDYWSSTRSSSTNGWRLDFNNGHSDVGNNNKAFGFSIRCLKE